MAKVKNRSLVLTDVGCGETTCARAKGKFCRYMGAYNFGQIPVCLIFRDTRGDYTHLNEDANGWLARCPECLESEMK
jgi:hypothetical protein